MTEEVFLRVDASAKTMSQEGLESMATARWTGQDLATHKREKATAEAATAADKRNFKLTGDAAILRLQRVICSIRIVRSSCASRAATSATISSTRPVEARGRWLASALIFP